MECGYQTELRDKHAHREIGRQTDTERQRERERERKAQGGDNPENEGIRKKTGSREEKTANGQRNKHEVTPIVTV